METTVTVTVSGDTSELLSLREWLQQETELRGRIQLAQPPPAPGTMGALSDALTVAVGPGAAATVFASALVTWLRHRTGTARYRVTWPDGAAIEFSTDQARSMDAAAVREQVADLVRALEGRRGEPPAGDGPAGAA